MIPASMECPYFSKENIFQVFREFHNSSIPLIFHPEITSERFLYAKSPFRNVTLKDRALNPAPNNSIYGAAIPDSFEPTSTGPSPNDS